MRDSIYFVQNFRCAVQFKTKDARLFDNSLFNFLEKMPSLTNKNVTTFDDIFLGKPGFSYSSAISRP